MGLLKLVSPVQDVVVMIAGNVVFHGPRENVVPHFQSLGFFVPDRKAVSDFLQEVTSKKDQQVSCRTIDASSDCCVMQQQMLHCMKGQTRLQL